MAPSPPRLQMQGIRKRFGATIALSGVDLAVAAGQVHALVGENGAGKSTLMKVLSGAHQPDSGQMWLDGQLYRPRHPHDARLAGVAMIYQELSLAPHLSVAENIMLGMEPVKFGWVRRAEMRQRALAALAQLGRTDIHPETCVNQLPLAARQLVEIARAVAIGCRVLVLDEPTSSLSTEDIQRLFALVRRLKQQNHAIIYISHVLEEVKEISDRFTVLRDGKSVGEGETASVPTKEIISLMVGREVTDLYPRSPRTPGEAVLAISDLAGISKPTSASLVLHRGEVLGIAGLVGAGRTEFLRAVFGLDPVRRGEIKLGVYVGPSSPSRRWRQGMGMVSEDRKAEGLALSLSVADNVTLSRLTGFGPAGLVMPKRQQLAANNWIERLQIKCRSSRQAVASLSGGNQQKVALARLLQHDVEVLLLDEPTRGIDVGSKAEIYRVINELATRGKAVLMVSSYLPELLGVCDRVAVMCRGRLHPARRVEEIDEHQIMQEATGYARKEHHE
ncbi:MAG: sugar ABC transporter ATP-binding protein [candidate division KSB1 bacterium]|nr:sugar ABC transporter ATP-binding protein [candidate division KSB1 bacterium]